MEEGVLARLRQEIRDAELVSDRLELEAHRLRAQARGLEAQADDVDVQLTALSAVRQTLQQLVQAAEATANSSTTE